MLYQTFIHNTKPLQPVLYTAPCLQPRCVSPRCLHPGVSHLGLALLLLGGLLLEVVSGPPHLLLQLPHPARQLVLHRLQGRDLLTQDLLLTAAHTQVLTLTWGNTWHTMYYLRGLGRYGQQPIWCIFDTDLADTICIWFDTHVHD